MLGELAYRVLCFMCCVVFSFVRLFLSVVVWRRRKMGRGGGREGKRGGGRRGEKGWEGGGGQGGGKKVSGGAREHVFRCVAAECP